VDLNENGLQDPGEPGLGGATFLLRNSSTAGLVAVTVSNAAGVYHFSGVPAGAYYIEVVPPLGFSLTASDVGPTTLTTAISTDETLATAPFVLVNAKFDVDCGFTTAPSVLTRDTTAPGSSAGSRRVRPSAGQAKS
jgi:hypothetical protein